MLVHFCEFKGFVVGAHPSCHWVRSAGCQSISLGRLKCVYYCIKIYFNPDYEKM